jgi:hypothetical protein
VLVQYTRRPYWYLLSARHIDLLQVQQRSWHVNSPLKNNLMLLLFSVIVLTGFFLIGLEVIKLSAEGSYDRNAEIVQDGTQGVIIPEEKVPLSAPPAFLEGDKPPHANDSFTEGVEILFKGSSPAFNLFNIEVSLIAMPGHESWSLANLSLVLISIYLAVVSIVSYLFTRQQVNMRLWRLRFGQSVPGLLGDSAEFDESFMTDQSFVAGRSFAIDKSFVLGEPLESGKSLTADVQPEADESSVADEPIARATTNPDARRTLDTMPFRPCVAGAVIALVLLLVFLLVDIAGTTPVLFDQWTPLMLTILIVQGFVTTAFRHSEAYTIESLNIEIARL